MPTDRLNIRVNVEDLQIPLTVKDADEEKLFRDAAVAIQDRIQKLRSEFPSLQYNDKFYYVMAMLMTETVALKSINKTDVEPYREMMRDLEKEISDLEV